MPRVLIVFGTRPEAIKLAPVVRALRETPGFDTRVAVTAQHRQLLDQVLAAFSIQPDHDLDMMRPEQTLTSTTGHALLGLESILNRDRSDWVLVQGDTTTAFASALAGFYAGVKVGHVEAGLRTGDVTAPFPEEMNRVLVSRLAALHFAPTEWAASNLRREGVPEESICVTGNTGIDAVLDVRDGLASGRLRIQPARLDPAKKLILVTAHRRESFGAGIENICQALQTLAARGDVQIVYPVHPNPNVNDPVRERLAGKPNIHLVDPVSYIPFVALMARAHLILTDSGGIQEEAPSLGKPVLVLRDKTERPEAVEAGTARLVGANAERILSECTLLLDDAAEYERRSRIHNPYGDGRASARIRDRLLALTQSASVS